MKKSQKTSTKEKSNYRCYNIDLSNVKQRKHNREALRDLKREKENENNYEMLSMITQGLMML